MDSGANAGAACVAARAADTDSVSLPVTWRRSETEQTCRRSTHRKTSRILSRSATAWSWRSWRFCGREGEEACVERRGGSKVEGGVVVGRRRQRAVTCACARRESLSLAPLHTHLAQGQVADRADRVRRGGGHGSARLLFSRPSSSNGCVRGADPMAARATHRMRVRMRPIRAAKRASVDRLSSMCQATGSGPRELGCAACERDSGERRVRDAGRSSSLSRSHFSLSLLRGLHQKWAAELPPPRPPSPPHPPSPRPPARPC